ncbi:UPF0561 protein C2orf68 homolog [Dendronephthya gigantea]|uniref:UPF0561 protein C2orf68 homolog n=1 Tax=Dendronephthya gigantea TaxID=151771 RepID=UPI0010690444|nr:UPF0561 protein C2orf68 homolog [Dendronephthya gigantea]
MPPPKIDKSHGFMQSIVKNQVLRDEYDKEQKLLTSEKRNEECLKNDRLIASPVVETETKRNRTQRREAKQLYVPPHLKKRGVEELQETKTKEATPEVKQELKRVKKGISRKDEESRILFKFEYEGDNGEVRSILVKEDDNAEDLAETFGNQLGLTKTLRKALQLRLEMEIKSCYS